MVRIFLCSCNGEKYIREQVESILRQETSEPFQILASDDGSQDRTTEILSALQAEAGEERLRILRREQPSGCAWRHFLSLFAEDRWRGADYVMLSDQDDVWDCDKLERTLREMKREEAKTPGLPLLLHCDSRVADSTLRVLAPSFVRYQRMSPERNRFSQLLVQNNVVGGAVMVNAALSELLREVPEHAVMHDQWMALVASAFGRVVFLPESLYCYRQHGGNVLGAAKGSRLWEVLGRLGLLRNGKSRAEMDAHSRSVYQALFLQAEDFLRIYGAALPERERGVLRAFLAIPEKSRIGKAVQILRYGFTYNMLHRTAGELMFI